MANTYTQLHVQVVFSVKGRTNLIRDEYRDELEKYICGILHSKNCRPVAIYCNPDHMHVLFGLHPTVSVSDIIRDIKANSSRFVTDKKWVSGKFAWQDGFGAFSYSRSQIDRVAKYILNQRKHHAKKSFREEYLEMLQKSEVSYDPSYLFEWYD